MTSRAQLTVLYDADCGFCCRCATVLRRVDRAHRLRLVPLQVATSTIPHAPSEEELLATIHIVDAAGGWERGGAAWLGIASVVPALRPLAAIGRLPLVRIGVERLYEQVARNRHRLSRALDLDSCSYRESGQ